MDETILPLSFMQNDLCFSLLPDKIFQSENLQEMWYTLGKFILQFRLALLLLLIGATAVMGYFASQVKLSYDFSRAVPVDNPKYVAYQDFLQKFGGDGNILAIGIESNAFFTPAVFNAVGRFHQHLKEIVSVESVLSIPEAITLHKDSATGKLLSPRIFNYPYTDPQSLDSAKTVFLHTHQIICVIQVFIFTLNFYKTGIT